MLDPYRSIPITVIGKCPGQALLRRWVKAIFIYSYWKRRGARARPGPGPAAVPRYAQAADNRTASHATAKHCPPWHWLIYIYS